MNKAQPHLHACSECDLLITMPEVISHRSNVRFPRYNHSIAVGHNNARHCALATSFIWLILMFIAWTLSILSSYKNVAFVASAWLGKLMRYILQWSMVEVFLVGVLAAQINQYL